MMWFFTLVPLFLLLGGCASSHQEAFQGRQAWPVVPGAMSDVSADLPVYRSWPDRPYKVLGSIEFAAENNSSGAAQIAETVRAAKVKGGNAIILRRPGEFELGNDPKISVMPAVFSPDKITGLIIKWKSASEIANEHRRRDAFRKHFRNNHPNLAMSDELLEMGMDYGAFLGLDPGSPNQSAKLEEQLADIATHPEHSTSTHWLFRGTLHVTTPTTSFTDTVYGIASLTKNAESVALASKSGHMELSFTGLMNEGRLSGQLALTAGLASSDSRAEGVMIPGKISLDSRGQSNAEVVRGSFVFLH